LVVVEITVNSTNERIEVAIAIEIREGGSAGPPDINAIEGVSRASLGGVNRSGATTCVLVVVESAVLRTNERIEVAIAIDIRQGGSAAIPDINAIEGVSRACLLNMFVSHKKIMRLNLKEILKEDRLNKGNSRAKWASIG
jgi:hypothetical protein